MRITQLVPGRTAGTAGRPRCRWSARPAAALRAACRRTALAWLATACVAGHPAGAADTARDTDAVRATTAEAAREAEAARNEAAREKAALDGRKVPADWRLDTRMLPNDKTGQSAEKIVARLLQPRSDSWADWSAPLEPLHHCGEPRLLPPRCVPPPPCHPAQPPRPFDLVGVAGEPSAGPIYRGPCCPRTGTHDECPHPRAHRAYDRFFDWFYMWK